MDEDLALLNDTLLRWRKDARVMVREAFGATPDKWQARALELVSNPATQRLAFKACKGPGKTTVLAWIILWFLVCFEESKIGCTSITEANIDTNLWPELYKWLSRSAFIKANFNWTKSAITHRKNPNWFAVKRTWPKSGDSQQQADALAGIHADNVMFVVDESGGVPQAVMVTAEAVLANELQPGCRAIVVQAGNPTHTSGPLHRACTTDRALWEVITITGDPDDPDRSERISLQWAKDQIASYGRDNPWVMVNVLGMFPPASINALLGIEEVEAAMRRKLPADVYAHAQKRIGVDVARFGDDRTVLFPRQGLQAFRPIEMRNANTAQIAGRVARGAVKWGAEMILVDDTGHWGHGVIDQLQTAGFPATPVVYHAPATDPRYRNMRAQMWMEMADWVKKGGALPFMPELVRELTEITYSFVNGRFVLEEKDQLKERLGYSPDLADALATTFAMPDMPGGFIENLQQRQAALRSDDVGLMDNRREAGRGFVRTSDSVVD
jgi:hypothetical protein